MALAAQRAAGLRPATQRPEKIQPSWRLLGTGGKKAIEKGREVGEGWREGWMDGEQEQQVKGVVRRQRAVWSSVVTQQLVLRKVLLRENLTQRNKGFVVMSSWSLKDRKCRLFPRKEKHWSHSVGGFGRLWHNHVVKNQNGTHLKTERTTVGCHNYLSYSQTIPRLQKN